MLRFLILPILFGCSSTIIAQELNGSWTYYSYQIGNGKETKSEDKSERVKIIFNRDGSYLKTYNSPELPEGATVTIHMSFNFLSRKTTNTYFDKDGNEIKNVRTKKMVEKGKYVIDTKANQVRFASDTTIYNKTFRMQSSDLVFIDTIMHKVFLSRFRKK
jgi:hypothetical protein